MTFGEKRDSIQLIEKLLAENSEALCLALLAIAGIALVAMLVIVILKDDERP